MEHDKDTDEELWKLAIKRAQFKRHLMSYLIVNGFLWAIWFSTKPDGGFSSIWPIWPTLGWGLGLFINHREAYADTSNLAQNEFEKLKKEREK